MILDCVKDLMSELGLPYAFWEWPGDIPDLYFVGELLEDSSNAEDGRASGQVILSGWSKSSGVSPLLDARDTVRAALQVPRRVKTGTGAVVLEYSHAEGVPSDVEGAARMEIYIDYNEWSA